jgi:hypothetical protein
MISASPHRSALVRAFAAAACIALLATSRAAAQVPSKEPGLIAHEWGTFTSIAGANGQAIDWLPLTASVDSPAFVHRDLLPLKGLPGFVYHSKKHLKFGLRGTIRMETPVLYFYTSRDLTLSVHVSFTRGLITEWYPSASQVTDTEEVTADTLVYSYKEPVNGILGWDSVTLEPGVRADLPHDAGGSRYYAARETSSSLLRVNTTAGVEHEKFLFYRGISAAPVPIAARSLENDSVAVTSLEEDIPNVILFERRGQRAGFRLGAATGTKKTILDPPALADSIDSLTREMETLLVTHGLFPDEARAMLHTWEDSWFEEGSRLIYIVPASYVSAILPLAIHPAPQQTVRVFVGRMEIISPATVQAVEDAISSRDAATVGKYCRFLEPIRQKIKEQNPGLLEQAQAGDFLYEVCH